jgi:hypothetical protein
VRISVIEGIGSVYGRGLGGVGIRTTDDLFINASTPEARRTLAARTGIGDKQLLRWANMADLMRLKRVGTPYAELLEAAGVDTVTELKTRRADDLLARLTEIKETRKRTRAVPGQAEVQKWIDEVAALAPAISS